MLLAMCFSFQYPCKEQGVGHDPYSSLCLDSDSRGIGDQPGERDGEDLGRRWKGWRGLGDPKGGTEGTVNWPWPEAECPGHPHHRLSMSQFRRSCSPTSPALFSLSTAMKVTLCLGLLLTLAVTACQCRPAAEAPGTVGDPQQHPPSLVRRDWPQSLSQEQQHLLSQFLPHILTGTGSSGWAALGGHSLAPVPALTAAFALAELNNHKAFVHEDKGIEALHDHYYPDWMDFGRRSAEDEAGAA